jgi:hypothetical protein
VIDTIATVETPAVTYTIAKSDIDLAIERIKKANQRATRIGQSGYTCSFTEAEPMPVYDEIYDGSIGGFVSRGVAPLYYIEMAHFTVTGMVPKLGSWEVIALLEDDEHAGVVSRVFPGVVESDLSGVKIDAMGCDHCRKTRARTKTYVLRDQAGNLIKVGKSCLSLYTGITVSGNFDVTPLQLDDEMKELAGGWANCPDLSVPVSELLALAVGAINLHGWRSRGQQRDEGGTATADYVYEAFGRKPANHENHDRLMAASDPAKATAVLDYCRTALVFDGSEYVNNLIACTSVDLVSWKNFGLVISAVASYDRHVAKLAKAAVTANSVHVGTVGTRERFDVTVIDTRTMPGYYSGVSTLVKMVTAEGAVITWFASKGSDLEIGQTLTIAARVKKHTVYQGDKETQVTNVKQV